MKLNSKIILSLCLLSIILLGCSSNHTGSNNSDSIKQPNIETVSYPYKFMNGPTFTATIDEVIIEEINEQTVSSWRNRLGDDDFELADRMNVSDTYDVLTVYYSVSPAVEDLNNGTLMSDSLSGPYSIFSNFVANFNFYSNSNYYELSDIIYLNSTLFGVGDLDEIERNSPAQPFVISESFLIKKEYSKGESLELFIEKNLIDDTVFDEYLDIKR